MAVTFRGTRADLVSSLNKIPRVLAGKEPDALGLRELFWGTLANEMLRAVQDAFEVKLAGGTDFAGQSWEPLSAATIERRLRSGRTDQRVLLETEELIRSLTPGTGAAPSNAPEQINELLPDGVRIGTSVGHAEFHQRGVPNRLPARPFMPTDDLPPEWERVLEECAAKAMKLVIERVVSAGGL